MCVSFQSRLSEAFIVLVSSGTRSQAAVATTTTTSTTTAPVSSILGVSGKKGQQTLDSQNKSGHISIPI